MPDTYLNRRTNAFAITPADGTPIKGPKQSDGTHTPYCNGFHAVTTGNINAVFKDDRSLGANGAQLFPVIEGTYYPYALSFLLTTDTTATIMGML